MHYQKIVLGYDESEAAKLALERASTIAKVFGSKLVVTSVAPVVHSVGRSAGPIDSTDPPAAHIEELNHAKTYLEGEGLQAELIPALGDPAETIAEVAKEHDADLIVVGTHEPSVIGRLFGQSVTEAVVHKVHCDVLIVHPGHH
jgi:nucleotide-binding universal stress UspA family protein